MARVRGGGGPWNPARPPRRQTSVVRGLRVPLDPVPRLVRRILCFRFHLRPVVEPIRRAVGRVDSTEERGWKTFNRTLPLVGGPPGGNDPALLAGNPLFVLPLPLSSNPRAVPPLRRGRHRQNRPRTSRANCSEPVVGAWQPKGGPARGMRPGPPRAPHSRGRLFVDRRSVVRSFSPRPRRRTARYRHERSFRELWSYPTCRCRGGPSCPRTAARDRARCRSDFRDRFARERRPCGTRTGGTDGTGGGPVNSSPAGASSKNRSCPGVKLGPAKRSGPFRTAAG